jgi:nucleoid DNA-binding protein
VISILFDEIVGDLKSGKEVKIANFGTLVLKEMPPRRYYDVRFQKIMQSPGNKIIRLFLSKPIRKKLCNSVDIDTKIKDGYNE